MIATISVSLYPDVPNVPGVPPVLRSPLAPPTPTPPTVTADSPAVASQTQSSPVPQWGVFDSTSNKPVIVPDTVAAFEFKLEYSVPDYPIEQGGFASYNKVARPYDARFTMSKGGSQADRTTFLTSVQTVVANLTLYNVATPEYTWTNANLVHWDIKRTSDKGATLLTVELWLREIRVAPAPAFASTKAVSGQSPNNGGTVQATPPTAQQATAATDFV